MHGIFITGTSTGVGKTHVGILLAKALAERNIQVNPRKPVESGCRLVTDELAPADALALKSAANYPGELAQVCPHRFQPPVSPARAARLAGTTLTIAQLVDVCRHGSEDGFTLVEGAGGFFSPLTEDGLNADLATALQLPVLLVAENTLGVLNQVLLNVEAIEARGLELVAVVLNSVNQEEEGPMDNAADLRERLNCPVFAQPYNEPRISGDLVDTAAAGPVSAVS